MTILQNPSANGARTLIDELLEEQRNLTAVERFSRAHDDGSQSGRHRSLIPLSAPGPGEQYAFEVDLDSCSGCKSCVTACHSLNGLDEGETWRGTGLLHGRGNDSFQQTVTTACHHCVDPACLNGCPVLAYDKDPATGIVRHLDDQCIGCEYCVLMCPYDVPKYSESRGIVRKCDMCHQRLAHGDAPACVQACPSEAIRITVVRQEDIGALYRTPQISSKTERNLFLPTSPNPAITLPTTRYVSKEMLPAEARSADPSVVKLQPAHRPLVWMLSLTQLGAGGFVVLPFASKVAQPFLALMSLAALLLGLAASILHLGRPEKAWRVFLGLRRSWLSREVVVFGAFTLLAIACTCATMLARPRGAGILLETITAAAGLSGVFCSGMAYHVTRRDCWRGEWSVGRFFASTLVLGLALAWCASAWVGSGQKVFALCLGAATLAKLSREFAFLRLCADDADLNDELPDTFAGRAAFLMRFRLGGLLRSRLTCAWAGGVAMPLIALIPAAAPVSLSLCGLLLCLAGEWLERAMFFRTAVTAEMPGGGA